MGKEENQQDEKIKERRQRVYFLLAAFFLGSLSVLNLLGISRFVDLSFDIGSLRIPFVLAIGVLPYPLTFLCTDLISELYGRRQASFVVWVGLLLNAWTVFILWIGGVLPGFEPTHPDSGEIMLDAAGRLPLFYEIRELTFGVVVASMVAYLTAQFCDVHLFHFWKKLTKGKHLWLRNNGSTLVSQFIDTFTVTLITHFYANALPIDPDKDLWAQLWVFIGSGYIFKLVTALLDTGPFYVGANLLRRYLELPAPEQEYALGGGVAPEKDQGRDFSE